MKSPIPSSWSVDYSGPRLFLSHNSRKQRAFLPFSMLSDEALREV